jgi:threonine dehydrogenase-like Zn-dependent dehydrogenase
MKAVVWHGIGDIRLDEVPKPTLKDPTDAIVRLTASAICGTDLHFIRGTFAGMKPGTILGHEGVGIVEELGRDVRNFSVGDRVVIGSTVACGECSYCRAGYYSQCDKANPGGNQAGTVFFGGPPPAGGLDGLQAEYARIPYAHVGMVKLPDEVSDAQAILISDIFPTAYFGADMADIKPGHTVAVFGCGPVGLFTIASARLMNAGRIFAVDAVPSRLAAARALGAETVNFNEEHPVETLQRLTGGVGVDCAIDAVGVDAYHAHRGPAAAEAQAQEGQFGEEMQKNNPQGYHPQGSDWVPGDAPSQALMWEVESLAKAGTLSIIGVYPLTMNSFPIGAAMNRNLTLRMGNCPHRKYIPRLVDMVRAGVIDPTTVLTQQEPMASAIDAYKAFDERRPGWIKVELEPQAMAA